MMLPSFTKAKSKPAINKLLLDDDTILIEKKIQELQQALVVEKDD